MRKVSKNHGLYKLLPDLLRGQIVRLQGRSLEAYVPLDGKELIVQEVDLVPEETLTGSVMFSRKPVRTRFVVFGDAAYYFELPTK